MQASEPIDERVTKLVGWYGDGSDGAAPTREQWRRLLTRPAGGGPVLVNLFKLRKQARYPADTPGSPPPATGPEAFARYSAVSVPGLARVGGRFLAAGPFASTLMGEDEDWDLVAVGGYPDNAAVVALFEDPAYRDAFAHRRAACERQKVFVLG